MNCTPSGDLPNCEQSRECAKMRGLSTAGLHGCPKSTICCLRCLPAVHSRGMWTLCYSGGKIERPRREALAQAGEQGEERHGGPLMRKLAYAAAFVAITTTAGAQDIRTQ